MIVFKKIRWKNFLSTGNDWSEIELEKNNTTLIVGENGAGKSTLLDAITYALYNKPFRKINKPQLINSINSKKMLVEIEFTINKDEYLVRRGMKPNTFEIIHNGDMINQDASAKDYQDILEKQVLRLNYKSFCQVVILGSASFVPFMQLPAWHRREIIEDLLDLQIFTTMNTLLKDKMAGNDRDILDIEYNIDLNQEKIKMQEKHLEKVASNFNEVIKSYQKKIKSYQKSLKINENLIDESLKKVKKLEEKVSDEEKIDKKFKKMQSIKTALAGKIDTLTAEKSFFNEHEYCPTCKQNIDEDFKHDTVKEKIKSIEETQNGLGLLEEEIEKIITRQREIGAINKQISDLNTEIYIKNNDNKNLNKSITELEDEIETMKEKNEQEKNSDTQLKELETAFVTLSDQKKDHLITKQIYHFSSILLKDTGIKSRIIKQYVPVINKLINKYLAEMEFVVQFELDESFNETIKSRHRDVFSYASFSEGEKMRINLAILFTWRAIAKIRNSASTNLLILDEIFDGSLDSAGTDEFMKILRGIVGDINTFIISHKTDQLYDKFDSVIKFKKNNNFSQMTRT